jgi:uncharacterized protein (DUF2164 family)
MAIELEQEIRKSLIASIRRYAEENLEEEMGDLKAELLLDYFLQEVGPTIYNVAITEARSFLVDRLADLESTCYEPEMTCWPKSSQ